MLELKLRQADFEAQNKQDLVGQPLLKSIRIFWQTSDREFAEYLEQIGINYFKQVETLEGIIHLTNDRIEKLSKALADENIGSFRYDSINILRKNLKKISENDFYTLSINLSHLENKENMQKIIDNFLNTQCPSIIQFSSVNKDENILKLTYHRRGAIIYDNNLSFNLSKDYMNMLENFKEPKDNNFIVARFLSDFAFKLQKLGINESFYYKFHNNSGKDIERVESIENIILWSKLSKEEKEEKKIEEKEKEATEKEIHQKAKQEIKNELNEKRDSLPKDSNAKVLEKKQLPKLHTINSIEDNIDIHQNSKKEIGIDDIVEQSIEEYTKKELEKARIKLEQARKESINAYNDLKYAIFNGSSILEAIRSIQQKYRNEDTVNFATLLFGKDILNVGHKDKTIETLNNNISNLQDEVIKYEEQLESKNETLSKWQSNFQKKQNEIEQLKYDFEQEIANLRIDEQKIADLESHLEEQDELIKDLESANIEFSEANETLNNENMQLKYTNNNLEKVINELKDRNSQLENKALEAVRLESRVESLNEREKFYISQIKELNNKIEMLYEKLLNNGNVNKNETNNGHQEELRAKDILKANQ